MVCPLNVGLGPSVEGEERAGPLSSSPRHPPVSICRLENLENPFLIFFIKIDQTKQKYWDPRSKISKGFSR